MLLPAAAGAKELKGAALPGGSTHSCGDPPLASRHSCRSQGPRSLAGPGPAGGDSRWRPQVQTPANPSATCTVTGSFSSHSSTSLLWFYTALNSKHQPGPQDFLPKLCHFFSAVNLRAAPAPSVETRADWRWLWLSSLRVAVTSQSFYP